MISKNIKEATLAAHQQLEKKVILKLKAIKGATDYADLLKYFYAYFNGLEKAIAPYITITVLHDYADRRNSSYLKDDLFALDANLHELPEVSLPEIHNALEAMAALYVMEGSVLGGSIIVQILAKHGITQGVSFFSGYGADTGRMWGGFLAALDLQANSEQDVETAIEKANETFACFSASMENPVYSA